LSIFTVLQDFYKPDFMESTSKVCEHWSHKCLNDFAKTLTFQLDSTFIMFDS
jgi:hypothetical protein